MAQDTTIVTFADDTAILATDSIQERASKTNTSVPLPELL